MPVRARCGTGVVGAHWGGGGARPLSRLCEILSLSMAPFPSRWSPLGTGRRAPGQARQAISLRRLPAIVWPVCASAVMASPCCVPPGAPEHCRQRPWCLSVRRQMGFGFLLWAAGDVLFGRADRYLNQSFCRRQLESKVAAASVALLPSILVVVLVRVVVGQHTGQHTGPTGYCCLPGSELAAYVPLAVCSRIVPFSRAVFCQGLGLGVCIVPWSPCTGAADPLLLPAVTYMSSSSAGE